MSGPEISNQMELNGEVSIWLEISINWHTKSQGPKKKVPVLQEEGGSIPAPPTPPVIRVVLLHTERFVESLDSQTVFSKECEIYFEIKPTTIL